jgi:hypothetical protein
MLISHRKQFIFTRTAKTASRSVESWLKPYCLEDGQTAKLESRKTQVSSAGIIGAQSKPERIWPLRAALRLDRLPFRRQQWYHHMPASSIRRQAGRRIWNSYFKFCVVRNPFEKVVSGFHFFEQLERRGIQSLGVPGYPTMQERFARWVESQVARRRILADRDRYVIGGRICVDYIVRYEQLLAGLQQVCQIIDVPFTGNLPALNTGFRPPERSLEEYYDERTRSLVARTYAFELDYFGYRFPDSSGESHNP